MARSNKDFNRDEFSSLLGVTGEHEALEAVKTAAKPKTPALAPRRHRDQTHQRAYHELLVETIQQNNVIPRQEQKRQPTEDPEDDLGEEEFTPNSRRQRPKAAPVIMSVKVQKDNDDGDSTSFEENGRRDDSTSSSSSDDDAVDNRRQKLLNKRKKQVAEVVAKTTSVAPESLKDPSIAQSSLTRYIPAPASDRPKRVRQASSSSESSSGSSDEESSSSDEEGTPVVRPVFIPKQNRGLKDPPIVGLTATNAKPLDDRRIAESRALVQQAVTTVKMEVQQGATSIDGVTGAMNDVPDDSDANLQRLDWVVRELERLLLSHDLEEERSKELADRKRRRHMTDEERMAEDAEFNATRQKLDRKNQRFFHRGAFYMDKSEWDETDVRLKAEEYAAAVTGDDKHDRSQLPKVMQVKKFGFANQSKWKGLAKEDTTDKRMDILPLKNGPKKK